MGVQITEENHDPKKPLPNEMQERFCQLRSCGYSEGKAFIKAQVVEDGEIKEIKGPTARTYGWRLLQKVYIKARIEQIRKERFKKFGKKEKALEKALFAAMMDETYSHANHLRACEIYMKFLGLGMEQHVHTHQGSITIKNNFRSGSSE